MKGLPSSIDRLHLIREVGSNHRSIEFVIKERNMASSDFSQKFIALLVLSLVVMGCTKEPEPIPVDSLTLSSSSITLGVGESHTIIATISPSDADNQNVLWSSSDPSVVSVNDDIVTAISAGFTKITARSED